MTTQNSLAGLRSNAGAFAKRWKGTTQENANSQLFWAEFLGIFGVDPKRSVLFERQAQRFSTGNHGRIDVFWPGEMLVEQKSAGRDLAKASAQAFDYLDGLSDDELPSIVVVSDFENFEVYDTTVFPFQVTKFKLNQLPQRISLFTWMAGYTRRTAAITLETLANKRAVKKMASLYDALAKENLSDHHTSVFLARMLFLLFAEDTGLTERGLFTELIRDHSREDGTDLGGLIAQLFQILDTDPRMRSDRTEEILLRFPYVNGGIFGEQIPLTSFDRSMRTALLEACDFEWGSISPAVFGSMFQAVKSKELRRELGEHYTTEDDILKTLGPLILDELNAELAGARFSKKGLDHLWDRIANLRFLDPACGCGNFLVIAYRELRALELAIMERLDELGGSGQRTIVGENLGLRVNLAQMHGIEIEEWPARIAEVALFIVDHQANRLMLETIGSAPERLPIQVAAKIVTADALLTDWEDVVPASADVVIMGNPPFSGQGKVTDEQTETAKAVWGKRYSGYMDFVSAWYAKAIDYYGAAPARWAFVSTSSIAQGIQVPHIFKPIFETGWDVNFAHRGFNWTTESSGRAGVHVSIIGFQKHAKGKRQLFTYADGGKGEPMLTEAKNINGYLLDAENIFVATSTKPVSKALPPVSYGIKPVDGGNLIVTVDQHPEVAADLHAAKYLRPFLGAKELIHGIPRWCLWLVDVEPSDLRASPLLRERIAAVKELRLASPDTEARNGAERPHELLRARLQPTTEYLAIPRHFGESRAYCTTLFCTPEIVQSDANFMAPDPDGFLFGIISSKLFLTWQKMVGGRIRSDLRFANRVTWNTFPLPNSVPEMVRERVCTAAAEVLAARELQEGRSLFDMYNPLAMRSELSKAHKSLDQAVYSLFGVRKSMDDEADRQELLFRKYVELVTP